MKQQETITAQFLISGIIGASGCGGSDSGFHRKGNQAVAQSQSMNF